MKFEVGKLYKCSDHYILIYPTRENAMVAEQATAAVAWAAGYWSKKLGCSVRCSEPNEIFIFIKEEIIEEHKYLNVLFGDKQGWIIYEDWMEIERVL